MTVKELLTAWQERYAGYKCELTETKFDLSQQKDLIAYNILCVKAMGLNECIIELIRTENNK